MTIIQRYIFWVWNTCTYDTNDETSIIRSALFTPDYGLNYYCEIARVD